MPVLSDGQLFALASHWFGDLGDDAVYIAVAVCKAESGGEQHAINDNYPRWQPDPNSVYRWDYGLMQINSVHRFDDFLLLADPDYNFSCARYVWNMQGWQAWSSYNAGTYLQFYNPTPPAPVPPSVPSLPTINDMYLWVSDAYYPAYDSKDTQITPVGYDDRYAIYELRREL